MNKLFEEKFEKLYSEISGVVLASLISSLEDISLAEDLLQEAFLTAYQKWQENGYPPNPAGWLTLTAKRKAIDKFRREKVLEGKIEILEKQISEDFSNPAKFEFEEIPDERLKLMFTCCHPSLSIEAQISLTLHTLGGLSTEEIAKAFLIPMPTLAQRLVRSKQKIKKAGIPYRVPPLELLPERLESLLYVLYLIFNEGYNASSGNNLLKSNLSEEAIRLLHILVKLIDGENNFPNSAEALGLLAMMLLHDSRKDARIDDNGKLVVLDEQDRSLWNQEKIEKGLNLLDQAIGLRNSGPYQIQAAISALHAQAITSEETDWNQIIALYKKLHELTQSPVVALNLAVAISKIEGPAEGLNLLSSLKDNKEMINYVPYYAAEAEMNYQLGEIQNAIQAYEKAIDLSNNSTAKKYFRNKVAILTIT